VASLRIDYLADHREVIPTLVRWFRGEWREHYGVQTDEDIASDFAASRNRDRMPIAFVAWENGEPRGTAALKTESLTTHRPLKPWLSGFYVAPEYRRRGVGVALVEAVAAKARALDFDRLYAATARAVPFFEHAGWRASERLRYHGEDVTVFVRGL
jgi:GNAT superfamily N-acetyltransferase